MPESDRNFTDSLIALKTQYERSLTEASTNASHLREQLSHVNALLLNQLLLSNGVVPQLTQIEAEVPVVEAIALASAQSLAASPAAEALPSDRPKPKASPRKPKPTAEPALASGKRSTRPLLPAYQGLTRLEAIAQLLQATPGQDVTTDQVSEGLFGKLSASDHKAERKSLSTQMYQGVVRELWQKGTKTGTFLANASASSKSAESTTTAPATKAQAPETTAAKRKSLSLLPAFEGMTKLDAIAAVLGQNLGEVLHQDTIIQTLYGDLSPEDLKKERVRMDTCLRNGVKNNKWKKAPVPASYVLEATAAGAKPKRPGRKPDPTKEPKPKPQPEPVANVAPASAKASAAKAKAGRKPAVGKAKTSQKVARSKKTELELVALLRKADIQV
jgi:hypothetical protein